MRRSSRSWYSTLVLPGARVPHERAADAGVGWRFSSKRDGGAQAPAAGARRPAHPLVTGHGYAAVDGEPACLGLAEFTAGRPTNGLWTVCRLLSRRSGLDAA